jgi:acyl-CoA reductase-like NAD-dependent aldehyde dehydrogenase
MNPQFLSVISPIDGCKLGQVPIASAKDVDQAVKRAKAFYQLTTRKQTPYERYQLLSNLCDEIANHAQEFAELITRETGKIIRDSELEISRAISTTRYAAEEAKRIHGEILPCDIIAGNTGKTAYIERRPIGVIAAITPFNFPINTVMHKLAPAIATGNTLVLKPSPKAPLSAELLRKVLQKAGLKEGHVEIIHGDRETGEALVSHPDVRMVTFTGGVAAGRSITQLAGLKKITLELGGNDPLVVMADGDLHAAAQTAIDQGLGTCGQRCTAVKRVFVQRPVMEDFRKILLEKTAALIVGDPMDPATDLGPMITEAAAMDIEKRVDEALAEGARLLARGQRDKAVLPAIIMDQIPPQARLINEETFGPVLPLIEFDEAEDCISVINSTEFGLQAGVYTDSLRMAKLFRDELDVGAVIINGGPGFRVDSLPFGGVKNSGLGREGVVAAIREMSEEKAFIL